ncbi:MAG: sulfurtransferase [Cyanobacteria bacterium SID2]|nr:sulfurtransferase [Cyanobacteria bacterium SID2]MBP0006691.1 sulfurtransferase [Cyanobacteria bacterium SBC]
MSILKTLAAVLTIGGLVAVGWVIGRTPTPTPEGTEPIAQPDLSKQWVVTPARAKFLVENGATWLDARPSRLLRYRRLRGAVAIRWQDFSQLRALDRGKLLDDDAQLQAKLRQLGIFNDRAVVVMGDPIDGWGEEGRIVWMLRVLGHDLAVMVDGGARALEALDVTVPSPVSAVGDFEVRRTERWSIDRETLQARLRSIEPSIVVVDARERREYFGETPYGEVRGGHVPGAKHLHYRTLLNGQGSLRDRTEIRSILTEMGVTSETEVVAYCTGGVRSGWLTAVWVDLGYNVRNYAGSMWEWSALPNGEYPLVSDKVKQP